MKNTSISLLVLVLSLGGCGGSSSGSESGQSGGGSGGECPHHGEGHDGHCDCEHGEGHDHAACEHGEGHHEHGEGHEHGAEHHHDMSPSLTALHDLLAPTWHAEAGATRAGLACTNAAQLDERARAVAAAAAPEGTDAATWTSLTTQLTTTSAALVSECGASGAAVEERLSTFHDAFHAIIER
ncbi:MAG: hypothetical protein U0353_08510 [Sandaracinus sp.]